jgi:prepilin-type N-terminal cleavage/methylation domain-containing protein
MINKARCGGFTLIELLVVLSVLAIMASLTLPSLKFSPKDAQITALTELRDTLSEYRVKALSKNMRITLIINEAGLVKVYEGDLYTVGTLGEEKSAPLEEFVLNAKIETITARGDEGKHSLTFHPDGTSSTAQFLIENDVLSFSGMAASPNILKYEKIKP